MAEQRRQSEGYATLTARQHWSKYALGMATEVLFILGLGLVGLLLAFLGMVIWR